MELEQVRDLAEGQARKWRGLTTRISVRLRNMKRLCQLLLVGAVIIAGVLAGVGSESATRAEPPSEADIARAIRDLGDARFAVREQASQTLWQAGRAAETALERALESRDAEVVRRAQQILERFRWGIYPDTPPEIVQLINQYRSGDPALREQAIEGLLRRGSAGHEVLLKIAAAEKDRAVREWFWNRVTVEIPRALPTTILEGNLALAERMIELCAQQDNEQAVRNFAAFCLIQNRLPQKIREYEEQLRRKGDKHTATILLYLHRAAGNLDKALTLAEAAEDEGLVEAMLMERGDWKRLAQQADERAKQLGDIETLGFRAAYHRLAGHEQAFEAALEDIRRFAAQASVEEGDRWFSVEALLVNRRFDEAIALLAKSKTALRAFQLLVAQARYREAFELASRLPSSIPLRTAQAEVLYFLGEKDRALQLFEEAGKELVNVTDNRQATRYEVLLESEGRLGLFDLRRKHAGLILRLSDKEHNLTWLFYCLYPEQGGHAQTWWRFLRAASPNADPADVLMQLHQVLGPQPDASVVAALAPALEASLRQRRPDDQAAAFLAIAASYKACQDEARVLEYLQKAVAVQRSTTTLTPLADWYADHQRWAEAAQAYGEAWEKDRTAAGLLFLRGWALAQAGNKDEGERLMHLASLAPLADDDSRHALLVDTLQKRRLNQAVRQQRELFLRIGQVNSWYVDEAIRHRANDALQRNDHFQAAADYERFLLSCLRPSISMVDVRSYLVVPRLIHYHRAKGFVLEGKADEAAREARLALTASPGAIDVVVDVVPGLDRLGRRAEADGLFHTALQVQEAVCRDYPRSATHHNSAAWLCATCRRELSRGLVHAQEAVRLHPDNPSYLDTLAEIQFQLGKRDEALELIRKCVELAPKRRYYKEQLKRIEAGDPSVPVPDENVPD